MEALADASLLGGVPVFRVVRVTPTGEIASLILTDGRQGLVCVTHVVQMAFRFLHEDCQHDCVKNCKRNQDSVRSCLRWLKGKEKFRLADTFDIKEFPSLGYARKSTFIRYEDAEDWFFKQSKIALAGRIQKCMMAASTVK